MKRWLLRALVLVAVVVVALFVAAHFVVEHPVPSRRALATVGGAHVTFDAHGIPTIEAKTWTEVMEAQGYVVASERMFQMDLMRHAGAGRISEWFGPSTRELDRGRRLEDWEGTATRAWDDLPPAEREYVEAYTRGVNRYIAEHEGGWGLEYVILGAKPEPWQGRDSLLLLLLMAEELAESAPAEASAGRWMAHLDPEWRDYLFALDHPWNQPMFGVKPRPGPALPKTHLVPPAPIDDAEVKVMAGAIAAAEPAPDGAMDARGALALGVIGPRREEGIGSNDWAWCGKTGCFVANDPHLGASVPALWYAVRLRISATEWMVGVSIPGMPGVTLGMNAHFAWGFTNVGEDVDDLLVEKLSADESQYLAAIEDGRETWKPVQTRESVIHVKGGADEKVVAKFTHRGPLSKIEGWGWCSRQWLPLQPGRLRLPPGMGVAKNWAELNRALDDFAVPAQNVVYADRLGNVGYRASGTGILRRPGTPDGPPPGMIPRPAIEGEWLGFAPPETRPRLYLPVSGQAGDSVPAGSSTVAPDQPRFVATANERIWVDGYAHRFVDEQRKDRIRRVLSSRSDFSRADMEALQRDTESRYRKMVVAWAAKHADSSKPRHREIIERWTRWNGVAIDDPLTFSEALVVDDALTRLLLGRVRKTFLPKDLAALEYEHWLRTAWTIPFFESEDGPKVFGVDARELADHLVDLAVARADRGAPLYSVRNRWAAQHPFANSIPVIGSLFAVDTPPQPGWRGLVRVEQPKFGASVRLVWDVKDPANSTWTLPVGQSGHVGSPHYRDLQATWFADQPFPVFDPSWKWSD